MKKIFTVLAAVALYFGAFAQAVIPNASFENWTDVSGKLYPNLWECDSFEVNIGAIQRVTPGSSGTYAMKLGSYDDGGTVYGATVEVYDTLIKKPGSLSFDYKVFNAPGFLNGLFIQIYFYDDANFLRKFSYSAETNNATFKTGTLNLGFAAGEVPTHYRLEVNYFNAGNNTTEYTIVDNFRFNNASTDIANQQLAAAMMIWPNPATDLIQLSNVDMQSLKDVRFISMDGRSIYLSIENSGIDVSSLSNGVYIMEIMDNNNKMIRREKIAIKD